MHPTPSRTGIPKRASKTKEPPKPPRIIQIPSFSQDVQLHKADHAWTPVALAKKKGAEVKTDDLPKKVRAILNKLTPQKFTTLVEQFQELPIDSQSKLNACMKLIFKKVGIFTVLFMYRLFCGSGFAWIRYYLPSTIQIRNDLISWI